MCNTELIVLLCEACGPFPIQKCQLRNLTCVALPFPQVLSTASGKPKYLFSISGLAVIPSLWTQSATCVHSAGGSWS